MNIGIRMEDEKDDSELSEQFAIFCASKKKEFHEAGIRRITFVIFYKQQFPRYFTYRLEVKGVCVVLEFWMVDWRACKYMDQGTQVEIQT